MLEIKEMALEKKLEIAKAAAVRAGEIQANLFLAPKRVIRKSEKELVSKVDMESQKVINEILKDNGQECVIFTEEKVYQREYPDEGLFWIVDPLDGTHNYIAGLPFYGVSIALVDKNNFYLGVIYLPALNSLFWGIKGQGAYCNNNRIEVSSNDDLSKSMVTFDNQFYLAETSLLNFQKVVEKAFTTRIIGSAAYDLCLIASGKIDARIWNNTKLFDIAAGAVIVSEAGGEVTNFHGRSIDLYPKEVIASNGRVHMELLSVVEGGMEKRGN